MTPRHDGLVEGHLAGSSVHISVKRAWLQYRGLAANDPGTLEMLQQTSWVHQVECRASAAAENSIPESQIFEIWKKRHEQVGWEDRVWEVNEV